MCFAIVDLFRSRESHEHVSNLDFVVGMMNLMLQHRPLESVSDVGIVELVLDLEQLVSLEELLFHLLVVASKSLLQKRHVNFLYVHPVLEHSVQLIEVILVELVDGILMDGLDELEFAELSEIVMSSYEQRIVHGCLMDGNSAEVLVVELFLSGLVDHNLILVEQQVFEEVEVVGDE
jgi:hypothetical protein